MAALLQLFRALGEQESQEAAAGTIHLRHRKVVDPSALREALANVDGGRPFLLGDCAPPATSLNSNSQMPDSDFILWHNNS